jgi:hypothetical protein
MPLERIIQPKTCQRRLLAHCLSSTSFSCGDPLRLVCDSQSNHRKLHCKNVSLALGLPSIGLGMESAESFAMKRKLCPALPAFKRFITPREPIFGSVALFVGGFWDISSFRQASS